MKIDKKWTQFLKIKVEINKITKRNWGERKTIFSDNLVEQKITESKSISCLGCAFQDLHSTSKLTITKIW